MFTHQNVALIPLEERHLTFIQELRNDESTWMNLSSISMVTEDQQLKWFKELKPTDKYFIVIDVDTKERVGMVRMTNIDLLNGNACVGCDVHPFYRGKGFGHKIMEAIKHYCFDHMRLHMLWLLVAEYNKVAKHVYEKSGFVVTGNIPQFLYRNGSFHNYVVMAVTC